MELDTTEAEDVYQGYRIEIKNNVRTMYGRSLHSAHWYAPETANVPFIYKMV